MNDRDAGYEEEVDWNQQVALAKRRVLNLRKYRQQLVNEIRVLEARIQRLISFAEETETIYLELENRLNRTREKLQRFSQE